MASFGTFDSVEYRDYAHVLPPMGMPVGSGGGGSSGNGTIAGSGGRKPPPQNGASAEPSTGVVGMSQNFPVRLHYMITELEKDGLADIISWAPHGRCFVVNKQDKFVEDVLNRWFSQSKFSSFQRQLNIYNFKRITSGPDKNGYYHEKFLRGKGFLAATIPRTKTKGTGPRRPGSAYTEPNFYRMTFLPPIKVVEEQAQAAAVAAQQLQERHGMEAPTSVDSIMRSLGLGAAAASLQNPLVDTARAALTQRSAEQQLAPAELQELALRLRLQQNMPHLNGGGALSSLLSRAGGSAMSGVSNDLLASLVREQQFQHQVQRQEHLRREQLLQMAGLDPTSLAAAALQQADERSRARAAIVAELNANAVAAMPPSPSSRNDNLGAVAGMAGAADQRDIIAALLNGTRRS